MGYEEYYYFKGHFVVGCLLILLALWWTANIFKSYFEHRHEKQISIGVEKPMTFREPYFPRICLEGYIKVLVVSGFLTAYLENMIRLGIAYHEDSPTHIPILLCFVASGILDLLVARQWRFPRGFGDALFALGFIAFGLVMWSHLQGLFSPAQSQFHLISLVLNFAIAVVIFIEVSQPYEYIYPLIRTLLVLTLGTWHVHKSFALYTPQAELDQLTIEPHSRQIQNITLAFVAHMQGNVCLILLVACVTWWCKKMPAVSGAKYSPIPLS